jgi:hypothetical protein
VSLTTVAVLYCDPRGPYPSLVVPGVQLECWGLPYRDARRYEGPWPVVAHPPCGAWGNLRHLHKRNDSDCAPNAVARVREFGGVLEHPAGSRLWEHSQMPVPSSDECVEHAYTDQWGGYSVEVNQVDWGHQCNKPTWLYCVNVPRELHCSPPARKPTHGIWYGRFERSGHTGPTLLGASKEIRRRTPPAFAEYLVSLARAAAESRAA